MKKNGPLTAVVLGCGERGLNAYGAYAREHPDRLRFVACAEPDHGRRKLFCRLHAIPDGNAYTSAAELLGAGLLADAVFICTMDLQHEEQALQALRAGYHVFLEKPMAVTEEGTRRVVEQARASGKVLAVGHVLRYSPLFARVKEVLDSGALGRVASIRHSENMGTWVFSHSFVRGNWNNSRTSSSLVLQKGCHDLDLLYWLAGAAPESISCVASPPLLSKENAPPGAPARCTDGCPHAETCIYESVRFYKDGRFVMQDVARAENPFVRLLFRAALRNPALVGLVPPLRKLSLVPWRRWPVSQLGNDLSEGGIMEALRIGPYGRCVYHADNDQPAALAASIRFANGITAGYTLHGMSYRDGRELRIDGTRGTLKASFYNTRFTVEVFDHAKGKTRHHRLPMERTAGGGGDSRIVEGFIDAVRGRAPALTDAGETLYSHLMCFAAERSIRSGQTERVHP